MSKLKELHIVSTNLRLENNVVKGGILPAKISELTRTVNITGETLVEGPLYAHRLTIEAAPVEIQGAVFVQQEIYINSDVNGNVVFKKAVGSASSVVSRGVNCYVNVYSDLNAKSVTLANAFVTGSIYADNISLENCVVIGGVFATQSLEAKNCVMGTFVAPEAELNEEINLLLPSVFTVNKIQHNPNTRIYSLALADLGALFLGKEESEESGRIEINLNYDDLQTTLVDGEQHKTMHGYSVVGKVLAADLIDTDKFHNHFLITAAALGPQLLKTYDLGLGKNGKPLKLTQENLRCFFFDLLKGKVRAKDMDSSFCIEDFLKTN